MLLTIPSDWVEFFRTLPEVVGAPEAERVRNLLIPLRHHTLPTPHVTKYVDCVELSWSRTVKSNHYADRVAVKLTPDATLIRLYWGNEAKSIHHHDLRGTLKEFTRELPVPVAGWEELQKMVAPPADNAVYDQRISQWQEACYALVRLIAEQVMANLVGDAATKFTQHSIWWRGRRFTVGGLDVDFPPLQPRFVRFEPSTLRCGTALELMGVTCWTEHEVLAYTPETDSWVILHHPQNVPLTNESLGLMLSAMVRRAKDKWGDRG